MKWRPRANPYARSSRTSKNVIRECANGCSTTRANCAASSTFISTATTSASSTSSTRRSRMATIFQSSQRSPAAASVEHVPAPRAHSVLELIGNTPLLEITRVTDGLLRPGVRFFAKLEGFNPGGSVKDRAVRQMLELGLKRGELRPGKVIIDSTSGNTGIALAMVGAALGYPVEIVMASNVSRERKKIIEAFGAKPIYSDPLEGSDGAITLSRKIIAANPERYFKPDQYNNEANPLAHFDTTGPEIWHQTRGRITHFVAGVGTGGTVMGAGRYL